MARPKLLRKLALPLLLRCATAAADMPDQAALAGCPGYAASNVRVLEGGLIADLTLAGAPCNIYGDDLAELRLEVTYETDSRLHIKIQDAADRVYQIPESVLPRPAGSDATTSASSSLLRFDLTAEPFSFTVTRTATDEVLFDSSAASLVFETQFLRLRTRLPRDPNLYGLGEHVDPFRLRTKGYLRTLWARDAVGVPENQNLYGSHPVYFDHRSSSDGKSAHSHAVFLRNSNGMDIFIDRDGDDDDEKAEQWLEYDALGGVIDLYFLAGPSPVEAARQYSDVVGLPAAVPYWGLGLHQCRYGYQDAFEVAEVVQNYSRAGIPLETMWGDIDYMDRRRVFTLDPDRYPLRMMRGLVDHLRAAGQHYVMMVDPAVAYTEYPPFQRGADAAAFLVRPDNGSIWKGVVWPGVTAFPDWFGHSTTQYWAGEFADFFSPDHGVDVDGLWIDMNEPSSMECNFPCADPDKDARGLPPPPPPVREPPRRLPGWPCEFQPPQDRACQREEEAEGSKQEAEKKKGQTQRNLGAGAIDQAVLLGDDHLARRDGASPQDHPHQGLPNRDLLYPKYAIHNKEAYLDSWNSDRGGLSNRTVLTDVVHQNGLVMYDTHNMFGHMMAQASRAALLARRPNQRPLMVTRSTFAGSGAHVGHWLGDMLSTWDAYRATIRGVVAFAALYQVPLVGSDVCGFGGDTTEALCARWASLGAFSPFYRNHNDLGARPQEFYVWESVAESARRAIDIRYRLLDYLYTALVRQSRDGTPAASPIFFLYPADPATFGIELQYFYGPGLLVAPVTEEGAAEVDVYLPDDRFYDWYTHAAVDGTGAHVTLKDQALTTIPLFLRGGVIVPARARSAMTTAALREQNFEILIPVGRQGTAAGELYLDDGDSPLDQLDEGAVTEIAFHYKAGKLVASGRFGYPTTAKIERITVLGAKGVESATWEVDIPLTGPFEIELGGGGKEDL